MFTLAKQKTCQRYIYKIHSSRLRKAKWKLTLPLAEARRNDELVSLADSQVLFWQDKLNGIIDADEQAKIIRAEIRRIKREPSSLQNRREIKRLYAQLDNIQFKPHYLCLIIDKPKDYRRACQGFTINGIRYRRLLGTNGGVKNETIVFVGEPHYEELKKRIENGRDKTKELVPGKLEAYKALTCSASIPVSMPNGILVVNDFETTFRAEVIKLSNSDLGEPSMSPPVEDEITLNGCDGCGMMLPSLAQRWAEDLEINYLPSGVNARFAFTKGMVFCFDFVRFAREVAKTYIVKDAWGHEKDIREVELVLTTSMLKLWDSYSSCDEYLQNCMENEYQFRVAKVTPKKLDSERNLNYQFIQSYDLNDSDIDELIAPTMQEISDILSGDYRKTVLFLKGVAFEESDLERMNDDFVKAIMIDPRMLKDPYIQSKIYQLIKNRINEAKVGCVKVHGNYSVISGDIYALCQSMFGLPVTGILKAGELYNRYWSDSKRTEHVACFRAPMTCHNNIRKMSVHESSEAAVWYQYMDTCTVLNSWDTTTMALNGADFDGDLIFITDNDVLVRRLIESPALMCEQKKAPKKVVTEEDLIQANISSFGDEIGKITNRITTMFEVRSRFASGSEEYKTLDYRIKCGQLLQQDSIDKTKGIISKPMPREWYDWHSVSKMDDPERKRIYFSILAENKPYFMRYIYPALMKQYNTYVRNCRQKALREFNIPLDDLLLSPVEKLTPEQENFLHYYKLKMPVGTGECVVNRICKKFEDAFDGCLKRYRESSDFDYTIMKSGQSYNRSQYYAIQKLFVEYNNRLRSYISFLSRENIDKDEANVRLNALNDEFVPLCLAVCSDSETLCEILLDICYTRSSTKKFAWAMCNETIITNLLRNNKGIIQYPVRDEDGDLDFKGHRFSFVEKEIGGNE